jgi:hypothetical protein
MCITNWLPIGGIHVLQTYLVHAVKVTSVPKIDYVFQKIKEITGFRWHTADGNPPVDIPICGYFDEKCRVDETGKTY